MRPKSRKAIDNYIEGLLDGCGARMKKFPGAGRGLVATKAPDGEPPVIFADGPLGRIVQTGFKIQPEFACSLCGHALGSPEYHLLRLLKVGGCERKEMLNCKAPSGSTLTEPVSDVVAGRPLFAKGKRPLFCSPACLKEHERIFLPLRKRLQATRAFARHARKCDCVFYLLAFKLICWACAEWRQTKDEIAAVAPLKVLFSRPYWDAVDAPHGEKAASTFRAQLRAETEESRLLALAALEFASPLPSSWNFLEAEGYANLLGALCCNAIAVIYPTPVVQHILQVDAMIDCRAKEQAVLALVPYIQVLQRTTAKEMLNDSDSDGAHQCEGDEKELSWFTPSGRLTFSTALFPAYRGYAIFPRLALANHSCQPSCAVEFTFAGSLFLLAQDKSDIQKESVLTISYLDASLGAKVSTDLAARHKRRRLLLPYGFECSCPCCADNTEHTSQPAQKKRRRQHCSQRDKKVVTKTEQRNGVGEPNEREAAIGNEEILAGNIHVKPSAAVPTILKAVSSTKSKDMIAGNTLAKPSTLKPIAPETGYACLACDGTGRLMFEVCPVCGGK